MQLFLIIFGIILILIFLLPIFEDVFNIATVIGIIGGVIPLALGFLWNIINRRMSYIIFIVYGIGFLATLASMLIIYFSGRTTAAGQDVIIVLGCRIKGDKPSLSLIKRVNAASDYLKNNQKAAAILSGGQGADENLSEALCMYNMLLEKGIDKNRLIMEDKSTNTDENIRFSLELIEDFGFSKNTAVATSEYHQLRTKLICRRYGITAYAQSSKTKLSILPTFLLREILGIVKEQFIK